jgi:hypothetical protein
MSIEERNAIREEANLTPEERKRRKRAKELAEKAAADKAAQAETEE